MKKSIFYFSIACIAFLLAGCSLFQKADSESVPTTPSEQETSEKVKPTETPTATPVPEPTATSTPEPTATPTPEPTATPTPEPTAMPTPEPTATPTPEPTATPTPEPTATPTPKPTATPTPKPTATPTPKPKYVEYTSFTVGNEYSLGISEGGVILMQKNGLWGALNYKGKEILPAKYNNNLANLCKGGYYAFDDAEYVYVFNNKGEVEYEIPKYPVEDREFEAVRVDEDVVTYCYFDSEWGEFVFYAYDLKKQQEILSELSGWGNDHGLTQMRNGMFYLSKDCALYGVDRNGTVSRVYEPDAGEVRFHRVPQGQYGVVYLNDLHLGVIKVDGSELNKFDIFELLDTLELKNMARYYIETFYIDGAFVANAEKKMVMYFSDSEGNYTSFYLLNFDKAEKEYVRDLSDVIVAEYEQISLSDVGIHYAYDGKEYLYIDDNGKVLARYKDCCPFYNGYAAVIDKNGDAYIINTKFERVSEIFEADRVETNGEAHLFYAENQIQVVIIDK